MELEQNETWGSGPPPPPFYRIALRFIKDLFQNKISDKSYTDIKHTLYVQILKIILNDFYTRPCNPLAFCEDHLETLTQMYLRESIKTDTIPFPFLLFNHISVSPWTRLKCPFPLPNKSKALLWIERHIYEVEVGRCLQLQLAKMC